jgi:predicted lipoprotein with Yx(FWY)xxD motif
MKISGKLLVAGVSLVAVALAQGSAEAARAKKSDDTSAAWTPPGITLQPLGKAQGYDLGKQTAAFLGRDEIVFANAKGMTLYTYEMDVAGSGKSMCVAECTEKWRPFLVQQAGFKPTGAWSVISREDGSKQWALAGKPLYTFVNDVDPGSVHGNSPAKTGSRRIDGAGRVVGGGNRGGGVRGAAPDVPLPKEWKTANAFPIAGIETPSGIQVREVPDATAVVLVNHEGRTLYAFNGKAKDKIDGSWNPAPAPQFAKKIGDFDFVTRPDGIKQWTYKGKALYTYEYDTTSGDAYGIGRDAKFDIAAVTRYYMPSGVTVAHTPGQGKVLATAEGMTLYRRDGHILQSGGGRSLRRGNPARPAVGRDIGIDPRCSNDCLAQWKPFLAPADAQPQGFWDVATRPDGQKQWIYQGYAMWTYTGDRKPGDMNGNDDFQYAFAGQANMASDAPMPTYDFGTWMDGAPAMYWVIATP